MIRGLNNMEWWIWEWNETLHQLIINTSESMFLVHEVDDIEDGLEQLFEKFGKKRLFS